MNLINRVALFNTTHFTQAEKMKQPYLKQLALNPFSSMLGVLLFVLTFNASSAYGFDLASKDSLTTIMKEELAREFTALSKTTLPPYYIDYRINEQHKIFIQASFGSLVQSVHNKNRLLAARVKVGDYSFDDSHRTEGQSWRDGGGANQSSPAAIPLGNKSLAIKQALWKATEAEYKRATESYKFATNNSESSVSKKQVDDFSKEKPSQYYEPALAKVPGKNEIKEWEDKAKAFSKPFLSHKDIVDADVIINYNYDRKYFVSSEGSEVVQNLTYANIMVSASIRATDGDVAPLYLSYFARSPEDLPKESKIENDIADMIVKLEKLKVAPLAEPYSGPAILSGASAGVFFHEIFGHRIEGHRLRNEDDSQTFKSRVDEKVLPKGFDIYSDPTLKFFEKEELNGAYAYDDEGVAARRVQVVKDGDLKTFLMSRIPLEDFSNSNGHGRAAAGREPVSRQSNLMVNETNSLSSQELRKLLIKECKEQGKAYGYLFQTVTGGYTNTDRYSPNAFNVDPIEVYRIFVDGRADELVRGVALIGTPLSMFAEIQAAGGKKEVFTGVCGAESGGVPVSAVAPALFVRRIETQKKPKLNVEPPVLPMPRQEANN